MNMMISAVYITRRTPKINLDRLNNAYTRRIITTSTMTMVINFVKMQKVIPLTVSTNPKNCVCPIFHNKYYIAFKRSKLSPDSGARNLKNAHNFQTKSA